MDDYLEIQKDPISKVGKEREKYVSYYNKLSEEKGSLIASSILFQLNEGLNQLIKSNKQNIKNRLTEVIDYLESELNSKDDDFRLKILISQAKRFHTPALGSSHFTSVNPYSFKAAFDDYIRENNGEYRLLKYNVNTSLSLRHELISFLWQNMALQSLLKEIVLKSYPNSMSVWSAEEIKDEINKMGRPFDETAPQDEIKDFIAKSIQLAKDEISEFKRFWHFKGPYEGTPNKSQLKDALIENGLVGELSEETVKERVYKALAELGY